MTEDAERAFALFGSPMLALSEPPPDPPYFRPSEEERAARKRRLTELRVDPPSPRRVARRLLCLGALGGRADLEIAWQKADANGAPKAERENVAEAHQRLLEWVHRHGIVDDFGVAEVASFIRELGEMKVPDLVEAGWLGEAAVPLLWALGHLREMPPYDWRPPRDPIPLHVPVLQDPGRFVERATLRPAAEIARARDVAELWHWRARTTVIQGAEPDGKIARLWFRREVLERVARWSGEAGDIPPPIHGDMPAFGKAYAALTEAEHAYCHLLAAERHKALNWLCGYAERWDAVPIDT